MATRYWSLSVEDMTARFWCRVAINAYAPMHWLGIFRWLYGGYLILFDLPSWQWIGSVPQSLFNPPLLSPAILVSGFPPALFFLGLDLAVIACLVLMTVGLFTRLATGGYAIAFLIGNNFNYSFGKIDHGGATTMLLLPCMIVAGWGDSYSVDARLRQDGRRGGSARGLRKGLALFAFVLCFAMLTAGLPKAASWIDFNLGTSGFLSWYYPNRFALGREFLLAPLVSRTPLWAFELGDYVAPVFELSGILALMRSHRSWRLWLGAAALFHLCNALVLNIAFTQQAVTYLAFAGRQTTGTRRISFSDIESLLWAGLAIVASFRIWERWHGKSSCMIFVPNAAVDEYAGLLTCIPVCAFTAVLLFRSAFSSQASVLESRSSY